ncbi:MAG: phosphoglucosamine mutase [Pseudomonadales bacterium]
MSRRYFGTDGIRGRVGEKPITPDFCLRLGWAVGKVLVKRGNGHVLIGKDTRISGYMLESVLESGLAAAGASVSLLKVMPTPAIAYLTRTLRADAGIVISASHNPYYDNGIKFFDGDGNKLPDEIEREIEAQLDSEMTCVDSDRLGKALRLSDAAGRYIEFCKASVPRGFSLKGLRIVLDCANGATYHVAPGVFEELGADVMTFGNEPNGTNINAEVGATHPEHLAKRVKEYRADLGIAFDGDGDRVVMVDRHGNVKDGDELLYVIATHRQRRGTLRGGVVGTVMTNLGLEQALAERNIPFARAKVGDRYVLEALRARDWEVGGETSGHVLCLDLATTGDAIVAALQVLLPIVEEQTTLAALTADLKKLPQVMLNVPTRGDAGQVMRAPEVCGAITTQDEFLEGRGRVLVRPSGTEPVIRVMVEGADHSEVQGIAEELAEVVRQAKA